jgi:hypothetical protein
MDVDVMHAPSNRWLPTSLCRLARVYIRKASFWHCRRRYVGEKQRKLSLQGVHTTTPTRDTAQTVTQPAFHVLEANPTCFSLSSLMGILSKKRFSSGSTVSFA